jgi:hypothetical protein
MRHRLLCSPRGERISTDDVIARVLQHPAP